jgi:hypothetical protein
MSSGCSNACAGESSNSVTSWSSKCEYRFSVVNSTSMNKEAGHGCWASGRPRVRDGPCQERFRSRGLQVPVDIPGALLLDPTAIEDPCPFLQFAPETTAPGEAENSSDAMVLLLSKVANTDTAECDQPGEVGLDRPMLRCRVPIGYGADCCVGAPLACLKVRVVPGTLSGRTRSSSLEAGNVPSRVETLLGTRPVQLSRGVVPQ